MPTEGQNRVSQPGTLQRLTSSFACSEKGEAITQAVALLSLPYERPITEPAVFALYQETLQDLTADQLVTAFTRAQMEESRFFPPPARLRQLAGCETPDQCSEREARDGLSWVMWRLRRFGIEGRSRKIVATAGIIGAIGAIGSIEECPPTPEPIRKALENLGEGDVERGVRLLAMHPMVQSYYVDAEQQGLGLTLSSIEKLERRWLEAWRRG